MANAFPKEPAMNHEILRQGRKPLKIYFGANGWGRKEWVGEVYPTGTKEKNLLQYYSEYFNSVELNATHYKTYTSEEIKNWTDTTDGKRFLFCPKVPQKISHYSFLPEYSR